jgi:tetratricopeptide (TPR) repeat protein
MLLRPALLCPDHRAWRSDPLYSPGVAQALHTAFARLAPPEITPEDFLWACGDVAPWLNTVMGSRQRIRIFLLFARAHEADGAYTDALGYVDRALEVAGRGHIPDDLTDLLLYHAKLERARARYETAAGDLEACLALLRDRAAGDDEAIDPPLRLELLAQLADYEFYLGHFAEATRLVDQAQLLALHAPHRALDVADVACVQAQLDRLRGFTWDAIGPMLRATTIYKREAPPISQGRIAAFVTELALDVVERLPDGSNGAQRMGLLTLARIHLTQAEHLTRQAKDRPGRGLARLAHARYSRLRGTNSDRRRRVEEVIRLGKQLDDHALTAQAFTALGDELASQGEKEGSLDCYRQTIGLLDGSEVPALAVPARRKLLRAREMSMDEAWQ